MAASHNSTIFMQAHSTFTCQEKNPTDRFRWNIMKNTVKVACSVLIRNYMSSCCCYFFFCVFMENLPPPPEKKKSSTNVSTIWTTRLFNNIYYIYFTFLSRRLPVRAKAKTEASATMTTITDDTPVAASPLTMGFTVRSRKVKDELVCCQLYSNLGSAISSVSKRLNFQFFLVQ